MGVLMKHPRQDSVLFQNQRVSYRQTDRQTDRQTMDNVSMVLSSEEGIHQGDPIGPVLFSLGIHNILATIQCKFQDIVVLAYLDDVFLVGSSLNVLDAFASLKQEFGNVGLQIQDKKCELYCPLPSAVPDLLSTDIAISHTGTTILGIPIGSHDFI